MRDLRRPTALAGLTLAFLTVLGLALDGAIAATTGGPPMIALATLSADLQRARASVVWPIETWVYTLQIVPFALFVAGLRTMLRSAGEEAIADVASLAAVLFMALHTLHNLAILVVVQVFAPAYIPGAADAAAVETAVRGLLALAYAAYLPGGGVGGLLFIVAMAAFAVAQRRSRVLAFGSGRLAAASAALSAFGYFQYIAFPALFIALVGWLVYLAWVITIGLGLLRSTVPSSSRVAARA
ncbi:MAG: hypothetical protein NVS1B1_13190 [Candidatus Limnocylindrales bacterium]